MSSSASTSPHLLPKISGYTIVEQLYLGSRIAVYRAVQIDSQRSVVIKVLQSEHPSSSELVQFRNQYMIAKSLPIAGIVQPLSLETVGNGYALVMEDVQGISLPEYLQNHTLNLADILAIALQLADTLHDLHQHRILHKDIKPANILIQPESKQVKLIDFSIASLLLQETQEIQNSDVLEGTLAYLAPEQTGRMNRGIDYRADFYALGVTLYQLLTGCLPFASDDPLELIHAHIAKVPEPVHQVNPSVPEMVGKIVAKLMAKNAEDRYQSALGLRHDLAECLRQWDSTGTIAPFELGQQDFSDRFMIPGKLYGCEQEIAELTTNTSTALDLATVLKVSQALSSEVQLGQLLDTLLQVVLENAGASKVALLLPREQEWFLEAIASLDQPTQLQSMPLAESTEIPHSIINRVKQTLEAMVVIDAAAHASLMTDPYVMQHQPKSMLCMPILRQSKLVAILYLENQMTAGAFTSDRIELLNILCAQAAISLEKAQLYGLLQSHIQQLEQLVEKLHSTEARLQRMADNIPGVVYQLHWYPDGSASTIYISPGCVNLFEVNPEEIMSGVVDFREMEHPDDRPLIEQAAIQSTQTFTPFMNESRIISASGKVKWVQTVARPEQQADGSIVWDGMKLDISDRKHAEQALAQKTADLETALQDLQKAQIQIVQSEKMSALGNLVAGVAHEINNPVGFIAGNLNETKRTVEDLVAHLALYRAQANAAMIADHAEEIDLDYLIEDLPKMLDSMKLGCDRIKSISNSLRNFSRADTEHKVLANVHEGLDSTLLILKYRLKANEFRPAIQVVQNYGELPVINCFPGQLNQVFMNILANAIDMFDEMAQQQSFADLQANPQIVTVQTRAIERSAIEICIRDNGKGMSPDVKARIFDHLFTTKGVGKGTGLGLAISRQIVEEKHGGTLQVLSELGVGTEFVIQLPIA